MRSHIFKKAGEHLLSSTIQLFSSSAKFYSTSSCFLSTPGPQIPHNATWKGCLEILPCAGRSQRSLELLVQSSDLVSSAFFKSTFPDSALTQVTSPREINQFALFILEPHMHKLLLLQHCPSKPGAKVSVKLTETLIAGHSGISRPQGCYTSEPNGHKQIQSKRVIYHCWPVRYCMFVFIIPHWTEAALSGLATSLLHFQTLNGCFVFPLIYFCNKCLGEWKSLHGTAEAGTGPSLCNSNGRTVCSWDMIKQTTKPLQTFSKQSELI